jgi:sarcosine oxidase gamma subunit
VEAVEVDPGTITSVAPFAGQADAVSKALEKAVGCALPAVGAFTKAGATRVAWSGLDQWFVMSPEPVSVPARRSPTKATPGPRSRCRAGSRDVLGRLVPIDLRPGVFEVGHAARTPAGAHVLPAHAGGGDRYVILVFRSMAASAAHDLDRAMRMVTGRAAV